LRLVCRGVKFIEVFVMKFCTDLF